VVTFFFFLPWHRAWILLKYFEYCWHVKAYPSGLVSYFKIPFPSCYLHQTRFQWIFSRPERSRQLARFHSHSQRFSSQLHRFWGEILAPTRISGRVVGFREARVYMELWRRGGGGCRDGHRPRSCPQRVSQPGWRHPSPLRPRPSRLPRCLRCQRVVRQRSPLACFLQALPSHLFGDPQTPPLDAEGPAGRPALPDAEGTATILTLSLLPQVLPTPQPLTSHLTNPRRLNESRAPRSHRPPAAHPEVRGRRNLTLRSRDAAVMFSFLLPARTGESQTEDHRNAIYYIIYILYNI